MTNIALKGAKNIRDLSQLDPSIIPGKLIRGGNLHKLTGKDIRILTGTYSLTSIIDLRTTKEREEKPDPVIPGVSYYPLPVFDASTAGISREKENSNLSRLDRIPDLAALYRTMVSDSCMENLSLALSQILKQSATPGATLYHCTEGKDRTGILSLLLLSLMDIPMETIFRDYLFTNTVARNTARRYYWMLRIFRNNRPAAEKVLRVFLADEQYLKGALDQICADWGSVSAFIRTGLHISEEEISSFRTSVLYRTN